MTRKRLNKNTDWTKYQKKRLIASFGGKCGICQYDKCHKALEFHHLNPHEKDFSFNNLRFTQKQWEKICNELRKCVMLCANCHREVHDNKTKLPKNIRRFDETYADYYAHVDMVFMDKCPICNNLKLKFNKTCSLSCAAKYRPKIDWSKVDLKKCVEMGYNSHKIASILNVSDTSVRYRLIKLGLYHPQKP